MPRVEIEFESAKGTIIPGYRPVCIKLDGIDVTEGTRSFKVEAGVDSVLTIELEQFVTERFRFVAPDPDVYIRPMIPEGMALACRQVGDTTFYYGVPLSEVPDEQRTAPDVSSQRDRQEIGGVDTPPEVSADEVGGSLRRKRDGPADPDTE